MNEKRKNTRKEAVALSYDEKKHSAPKLVAKGKGLIADTIIEKAMENDIPIQEDPSLLQVLSNLQINESIPDELYQAVAEVFAFIYKVDKEHSPESKQ
jgi:flagellar biosynthesis protein